MGQTGDFPLLSNQIFILQQKSHAWHAQFAVFAQLGPVSRDRLKFQSEAKAWASWPSVV